MKCKSCARRAAVRMENEPVTAVTLDWCHVVDLKMSLGHDLDEIFMVTSTMQHSHQSLRKKQQVPRKRRMYVLWSRLCCTGTGKCFRKSEVADIWTGLLCWSLSTAMISFRTFPIAQGAGQALHALISFRSPTCPNK